MCDPNSETLAYHQDYTETYDHGLPTTAPSTALMSRAPSSSNLNMVMLPPVMASVLVAETCTSAGVGKCVCNTDSEGANEGCNTTRGGRGTWNPETVSVEVASGILTPTARRLRQCAAEQTNSICSKIKSLQIL